MNEFITILDSIPWWVAVIVGIFSAGRLTRLWTADDFPPVEWARDKWVVVTKGGSWSKLAECLWCAAPWITLVVGAWAVVSGLHWTWWVLNGWMATSYIVSWLVFHDEDGISQR
jgi:hypothetical protein